MRTTYRKFFDYFRSPWDVYLFWSVLVWAAWISWMLKRHGLEELLIKISPGRVNGSGRTRRLVIYVNWWLNRQILFLEPTCLKRSLLLYRFLAREGLNVKIHYGVRAADKGLDGHSWLTLDGKQFLMDGMTAHAYKQTFLFPAEGEG